MATGEPAPTVSVIVPTHDRAARLPALVAALEGEADEIVIVANACGDETVAVLAEEARRQPKLKPLALERPGQMAALGAGAEAASGEVLLLLDDDVVPDPGTITGHARRHAEAGLVVLGYMPVSGPPRRRAGEYPAELYSRAYEEACESYERDPEAVLRGLWGGNVSLRRADALRVGIAPKRPLGDGYGYHEDQELGLRCAAAGLRGVFDRGLRASHLFERDEAGFLRAARNSGRNRCALTRAQGEQLDLDQYARSVPFPGRLLVRGARSKRAYRMTQALLRTITHAAGRLRLFRLETHAGYVMGVVEQQRGALEERSRARGPADE